MFQFRHLNWKTEGGGEVGGSRQTGGWGVGRQTARVRDRQADVQTGSETERHEDRKTENGQTIRERDSATKRHVNKERRRQIYT